MGMLEHEDYGPQRRAAEKAIGQTRDFIVDQVTDPLNYLGPAGKGAGTMAKVARGLFAANLAGKAEDANAMFFGGKYLSREFIAQIEKAIKEGTETAQTIFQKTGYFKNPQGEWRKYVTDKDAAVRSEGYLKNYLNGQQAKESLVHPDLYRIDPNPGNVPVSRESMAPNDLGALYPGKKPRIEINSTLSPEQYLNVLLHEVQHFIQMKGGVATGTNPRKFQGQWRTPKVDQAISSVAQFKELYKEAFGLSYDDVSKMIMQDYRSYANLPQEAKDMWRKANALSVKGSKLELTAPTKIPFQKYANSAGEVEAGVTQAAAKRDLRNEENGLTNLYDLFGKEIKNPDFYDNFQFTFD